MSISIIMPCHNGDRFLEAAILSVLHQSIKDWKLIIIDDASEDRSREIVSRYEQEDKRICLLTSPGRGVSAARNHGIRNSDGTWILFMDCDDLLPPDALETLFKQACAATDMIIGVHAMIDDKGQVEPVWPQTRWYNKTGKSMKRDLILRLIEGDSVLNIMCNKLHRRSSVEGLVLYENVSIAEDALYNLEATIRAENICYVHKITYYYRIHPDSVMNRITGSTFDIHLPWMRAMKEVLKRYKLYESFFSAFLDSVVLRLYKDGGVPEVVRCFYAKAYPLLDADKLDTQLLNRWDKWIHRRIQKKQYPLIYPVLSTGQIVKRKMLELSFLMRKKSEEKKLF